MRGGCITTTGNDGDCRADAMPGGPAGVFVGHDGKSAYVPNETSGVLRVYKRNAHGVLTPLAGTAGCVVERGSPVGPAPVCREAEALGVPAGVAIPSNGKQVYVTSSSNLAVPWTSEGISAFARK